MDLTAPVGMGIFLLAVIGGRILEGGNPLFLFQYTAAWIVFGGTIGAMVYGARSMDILNFPKHVKMTFVKSNVHPQDILPQIVRFAEKARREGLLSLEREVQNVEDDFMKQGLQLVADGTDPEIVKAIMGMRLDQVEVRHERVTKMYEAGAGYAPTVGIIGAVLGLIGVMEHLSEGIDKVGPGIAVAFVATIYGLVAANLILFPMASKLKLNHQAEMHLREMMLEGILSIQAGDNPRIIEERLKAFLSNEERLAYEENRETQKG
jgi:chemotaxis protein MotA